MTTTSKVNSGSIYIDPKTNKVSVNNLAGFDSQSAVDGLVKVKKIPIDRIQTTIDTNTKKITAYNSLRTKMQVLQDSLALLYGKLSFDKSSDIFQSKSATGSTTAASNPTAFDNLLGITAKNNAAAGTHSMKVTQLATNNQIAATDKTSTTTALGLSGSFTINGVSLTAIATDTLQSLQDKINSVNTGSNATGVTASITSVTAGVYTLTLSADKTGTANTIKMTDSGGVLQGLGLATNVGGTIVAARTLAQAQDALFSLDNFSTSVDTSRTLQTGSGNTKTIASTPAATGASTIGSVLGGVFTGGVTSITLTVNGPIGTHNITINKTDTVNTVVSAINAQTTNTGVKASLNSLSGGTQTGFDLFSSLFGSNLSTAGDPVTATYTTNLGGGSQNFITNGGFTPDTTGNSALDATNPQYTRTVTGYSQTLGSALSGFTFPNGSENFTITKYASDGVTQQATSTIAVNSSMTVGQFIDAVNSTSATTNMQASLENGRIKFSVKDPSLNSQIVLGGSNSLLSTGLNLGQTAVTSTTVSRSSNTVSDLLSGVTLNLKAADANTTATFTIGNDKTAVKNALITYANAYNDLVAFMNIQSQADPNTGAAIPATKDANGNDIDGTGSGPLFSESGFKSMQTSITQLLTAPISGVSNAFSTLAQIGFNRVQQKAGVDPLTVGSLTLDEAKLNSVLATNFDDVRKMFSFNISSTNQSFQPLNFDSKTMKGSGSATINFNVTAGGVLTANIGGDSSAVQITGNSVKILKGASKGLEFLYSGVSNTSGSFTVSYSSGLATNLNTQLSKYLATTSGSLDTSIATLNNNNKLNQTRVDDLNRNLENYRAAQMARFQSLEAALSSAQSTKDNITNAFSNNN
jgi:flagellar hook-associated protein 2